jgi:ferrous iron transport protein A
LRNEVLRLLIGHIERCYILNLASTKNESTFVSILVMLYRLSELKSGVSGIIQQFDDNEAKIKLMEMGCIPGESVSIEAIAPMGDPIAIQVSGYCLSLRKNEARHIWVEIA